ncbi:MAG: OmpA family protein [Deltaproteobacteria bacterium]|nr:OmpA family protein [Deltaproteobacteria bacterium]
MAGKAKPGFYIAIFVVIAALVGLAIWRFGAKGDDKKNEQQEDIKLPNQGGDTAEAPDTSDLTTVKEYEFVPSEKLPPVKETSSYKKMENNTVKFAINVWAGWAPIVHANGGFAPGKVWKTPKGKEFRVQLVLIDDPVAMRDAFAQGDVHIGWATVDMLPILVEGLAKDSRTMPRVFQQIDWSNGGDGIVSREGIKNVGELKGKTIVLAQNSPSHYFALNALLNAGVQPREVNFKFTKDAFQAAAAYVADKKIAAAVSWAPDIYKISEAKGNKLLVSTETANKLIADVWFARADFARDHKDIVEGITRGIFDSMELLKDDTEKDKVAAWMGKGYDMPAKEAREMLGDAHWTNYAENRQFFLNSNNPTNFERTYETAAYLYQKIRVIDKEVPFDQIVDFSIIKKLGKEKKYADQKDEYSVRFTPAAASTVQAESEEILTKTVKIHFYPNSYDLEKKVTRKINGKDKEVLYDPSAPEVVKEVGKLAGQYGAARIVIEGHTDSSMKGKVPPELVKELSMNRANAVKGALLKRFELEPNQFSVQGKGWERPQDSNQPGNHALNRRVEVKVYPLEAVPE